MIDFYSDTKTKPSAGMRAFIAAAEVGDEQKGEDPTTNALNARVAGLLGKEAAVFLPSGTMCNEIAVNVHCRPGEEIICDRTAHVYSFEGGGPSALSGVSVAPLDGVRGVFTPEQLASVIRAPSRYHPTSRLLVVEQTSNMGGGKVWPLEAVRAVCATARDAGLTTHMDGARLMNAVVASGVPASEYAASFDSVWIDFSKGLGAPVGAALAGSHAFIERVWQVKQRWGGALRQSGIIAAAGLYGLDHNVERLAEDHANARRLAEGLARLPGIGIDPASVETNLVYFQVGGTGISAPEIVRRLEAQGIQVGAFSDTLIRAVTHLDVSAADVDALLAALGEILRGRN